MSKKCLNISCANLVPKLAWIEGEKRNFQHRKYCFVCSPFGEHNTKKLEKIINLDLNGKKLIKPRLCKNCGKQFNNPANYCSTCNFNIRKISVTKRVQSIVGNSCLICGYNRSWRNICFHHVNPEDKLFCLSTREYMLKWERVYKEMKKCILVCHNCHGEIHAGIIEDQAIKDIWKNFWINKS